MYLALYGPLYTAFNCTYVRSNGINGAVEMATGKPCGICAKCRHAGSKKGRRQPVPVRSVCGAGVPLGHLPVIFLYTR